VENDCGTSKGLSDELGTRVDGDDSSGVKVADLVLSCGSAVKPGRIAFLCWVGDDGEYG
jgi:hypothetical protein